MLRRVETGVGLKTGPEKAQGGKSRRGVDRAAGGRSEALQGLEDFRRTVASSILKWVVSHQNYNRNRPRRREEARQSDTGPRKGSEQPSPGARASGSPSDSHWLAFPAFTGGLGGHDPHPTVAPELTVPRVLTQERTTLSRSPCGLWT
ncbi:Hypothetical predicted protein [Marmota monax]|uniref:Uncharacterized protein n=1 Tax=Marmota monax TaxID=9995 RepID=A0A5E4DBH3_MARMO|nr:Hypothetical predicted protein [Marmota monax]